MKYYYNLIKISFFFYFLNFSCDGISEFSITLVCHMIIQKSFKYAELVLKKHQTPKLILICF